VANRPTPQERAGTRTITVSMVTVPFQLLTWTATIRFPEPRGEAMRLRAVKNTIARSVHRGRSRRALGNAFPPSLLVRADVLIE
jgi:hypothetical protein